MLAALNATKHAKRTGVLPGPKTSAPKHHRNKFDPTFVPPKGCANRPRLYIVGEAPGEDEVVQRRPFVGRAGQMLDKLMTAAGIDSSQVRFFNAIPFRPVTKGKHGRTRNRTPTDQEIRQYSTIVLQDIRNTAPKVILASGKSAMAAIGIHLPVKVARRREFECEDVPVLATYHPQYVTYAGGQGSRTWKQMVADLRKGWQRSKDATSTSPRVTRRRARTLRVRPAARQTSSG
jgi:DNA polymerase